ncbi:MAG TPA: NHL repeat-containing protein [bacterium]|nr:NHL repeat-containing protein [bacterium]
MHRISAKPSIALLLLFIVSIALPAHAQTRIQIGQQVEGTLRPEQATADFVISGTGGTYLSIICDAPNRDIYLTLKVYDYFNSLLATNEGMNFPEFYGAYLPIFLPSNSDIRIRVEGDFSSRTLPAAFTLETREFPSDEENGTIIARDDPFSGLIGFEGDYDVYAIKLSQSKSPVWVTLRTPHDVLDGYLGVYTTEWDALGVNDDFLDTSPCVLFRPDYTGWYLIVVQGSFWDSIGPYELTVQTVWDVAPDDEFPDEIAVQGQSQAYFLELTPNDTVSVEIESLTEGFKPTFILFDVWRRLVKVQEADPTTGIARIRGYTPVAGGLNVFIVLGARDEETGEYLVRTTLEQDEQNNRPVSTQQDTEGILGPAGDTDTFAFDGQAGERISVWAWPDNTRTIPLDPLVRLKGPSGQLIAENDNAVSVEGSLISGVYLSQTGIHTIELLASPLLPDATAATGAYILSVTEGTGFDLEAPRFTYQGLQFQHESGQATITLASKAVADDTWPVNADLVLDRTGESQSAVLSPSSDTILNFTSQAKDIFFLYLQDDADIPNRTDPLIIPAPVAIARDLGLPFGLAVRETGEVFAIDTLQGRILQFDNTGNYQVLSSNIATNGGLLGPNALAFDHNGDLYLSNATTGEIVRYDIHGATETVVSGLGFPVSITFDAENRPIVCLMGSDEVVRIEPNGSSSVLTRGIRNPSDAAFGPNGDLFVTTNDAGNGTVYRLNQDGAVTRLVEPFAYQLDSIAVDMEGNLYVADGDEGWIWRVRPDGEYQRFAWGFSGPTDLAFGQGDQSDILYAAAMGATWSSYFGNSLSSVRTGKIGMPLPFGGTVVSDWSLY